MKIVPSERKGENDECEENAKWEEKKSTRQEKKCWKSSLSIFDELSSSPEREWRARMPTAAAGKCVSFPKKLKVERVLASFFLRWHIQHTKQSSSSGEEKSIVNLNISSLFFRFAFRFYYCEKGYFSLSDTQERLHFTTRKFPYKLKWRWTAYRNLVSPKSGSACDETCWRRRAYFPVR